MTVANNYAPIRQQGNGSTTQFSALWNMISATYAVVQLEDSTTGILTPVTQGIGPTQYQIVIGTSGFTVTMGTAPASTQFLNVSRSTTQQQNVSYRTSKGFEGEVEENSFDQLMAIVQENANLLSRNISVPLGDTATLQLPKASLRAGQFISFDASGNVIVVAGVAGVAVSSAMVPVVQATTLPLARTAMGVAGLTDNNIFTGTNAFPTQSLGDNSTKPATTAFVQTASALQSGLLGAATNLFVATSSGTSLGIFLDEMMVATALGGVTQKISNKSYTWNSATTGVNGMDTGGLPNPGWFHVYLIAKPDGTNATLGTISGSGSTIYPGANMPSGYTYSNLIGSYYATGANINEVRQYGRKIFIAKSLMLNITSSVPTTFTSLSISTIVPPNAKTVSGIMGADQNQAAAVAIAGDANGVGEQLYVYGAGPGGATDGFFEAAMFTDIPLPTAQTVYYFANGSTSHTRFVATAYTI